MAVSLEKVGKILEISIDDNGVGFHFSGAYSLDELDLLLQRFWETGFHSDWSVLESSLRAESFRMRDLQEEDSPGELARELNLPVTFDDATREIRPRSGTTIAYDRVDRCYIVPSAFNTKRLWAKYETGARRVTLYLPIAREISAANEIGDVDRNRHVASPVRSSINAESVFRALGERRVRCF